MTTAFPEHPNQNEGPLNAEKFQRTVLLMLGLALIGAASIALGFAGGSAPAVAIGAGVVLAAGAISVFNAIASSLSNSESTYRGVIRAKFQATPARPSSSSEW